MTLSTSHLPVTCLRLPNQRHIPGTASVPELGYLKAISNRAPECINEIQWRRNLPYRFGWFLFMHQHFWEAHEMWEPVWMKTPGNSRERYLLQGLIQLSNAGLKQIQGNHKAKKRILALAAPLIEDAFPLSSRFTCATTVLGISYMTITTLVGKMHFKAF